MRNVQAKAWPGKKRWQRATIHHGLKGKLQANSCHINEDFKIDNEGGKKSELDQNLSLILMTSFVQQCQLLKRIPSYKRLVYA